MTDPTKSFDPKAWIKSMTMIQSHSHAVQEPEFLSSLVFHGSTLRVHSVDNDM